MASSKVARLFRLLHRTFIAVLVLATLGVVALWVDSYRLRIPTPPLTGQYLIQGPHEETSYYRIRIEPWTGMNWTRYPSNMFVHVGKTIIHVRTYEGSIRLSRSTGLAVVKASRSFGFEKFGFAYRGGFGDGNLWGMRGGVRGDSLGMPLWFPTFLVGFYPLWSFVTLLNARVRTYARGRRGSCLTCGYQMRGNVSGRCPECGTAIQDRVTPTPSA